MRALLRNMKDQEVLDRAGAVRIPFLNEEKMKLLEGIAIDFFNKNDYESTLQDKDPEHKQILHTKLVKLLNSKVEYRCINCSPRIISLHRITDQSEYLKFRSEDSIVDERETRSINLIVPLSTPDQGFTEIEYIPGSHLLDAPFRKADFPSPFQQVSGLLGKYSKRVKLDRGDALLFYDRLIWRQAMHLDSPNYSLKIAILPYEGKLKRLVLSKKNGNHSFQFIQTTWEDIINSMPESPGDEESRELITGLDNESFFINEKELSERARIKGSFKTKLSERILSVLHLKRR